MKNLTTRQARIVSEATIDPNKQLEDIALFNADGTPRTNRDTDFPVYTIGNAIGTAAKTCASDEPKANTLVVLKFTNGNSAETPTVNFDSAGARAIKLGGTAVDADLFTLAAGGVALAFFDGTDLHLTGMYSDPA